MLCNLGNTSTAGNDTNNNANTNSSMEDDDSYPLPTIYRYVNSISRENERIGRISLIALPNVAPSRVAGEFATKRMETNPHDVTAMWGYDTSQVTAMSDL